MRHALVFVPVLLLAGCTWGINLDEGAKNVRTAWNGDVSSCQNVGKMTVSVQSRVGPIDRNDIKVRDELEVLARNQAAELHADTIKPLGEPTDGNQAWGAYKCGGGPLPSSGQREAPRQDNNPPAANGVETFPTKG
jgi:hypothetical protein